MTLYFIVSEIISSDLDRSQKSIFWSKKRWISTVPWKIGNPDCMRWLHKNKVNEKVTSYDASPQSVINCNEICR